ncbi:exported protein of unknown function [Nitrospira sp. KM1]|uniref:hypothetical protein n=1 Tax=Nitrospira sp. KM1 TaxID=1936990 RepID=UPI0013A739F6|nr:hypothetical protein [Nitrospira sp. KM1]BCA54903.1 exported protein of unknown function [Nitrospira sp. KM1]
MTLHSRRGIGSPASFLTICSLLCVTSCVTASEQTQWIEPGKTTKADVLSRYGEPDLLQMTENGPVATYRPTASKHPSTPVEIPTVQPGPFGTTVTTSRPVQRSMDSDDPPSVKRGLIEKEIHIRYNEQGIVQEVTY